MTRPPWLADLERVLSRRSFVRGLSRLAAALAVPWPAAGDPRPVPGPGGMLSPDEARTLAALVEAFVPPDGPLRLGELGIDHAANVEAVVGRMAPVARQGFRALLQFLERASFLFVGRFARFTSLTPEERARVIAGLERHGDAPHQLLFRALKAMAMSAVYTDPKVFGRIGYPGPWTPDGRPPGGGR